MELEERVQDLTDDYGTLHATVLDMVMTMRSLANVELLKFTKLVLLVLIQDAIEEGNERREEIEALIQSAKTDDSFDPLPFFNLRELNDVVSKINKKLSLLDFEVNQSKDMDSPDCIMYTFINKKESGSIKLTTEFTDKNIELIKAVIDRIFNLDYITGNNIGTLTYNVSHMTMINHIRDESGGTLSYDEAEKLLEILELQGWIERYHDKLTLSIRGLTELHNYLIDTYKTAQEGGSISICFGCNQIITRGVFCPSSDCFVRMHQNCKNLVKSSRESDSCPNDHCTEVLTNFNVFSS